MLQTPHLTHEEKSTSGLTIRQLPVWTVANIVATGPSSVLDFLGLTVGFLGGSDIAFTSLFSKDFQQRTAYRFQVDYAGLGARSQHRGVGNINANSV